MFDDDPETVRRVLKMLIESGEAIPPPADEPAEYARPDRADDEDGPAPVAVPV